MDFDFILTAIVYLLVIIFIHLNLRDFCGTIKTRPSIKPSGSKIHRSILDNDLTSEEVTSELDPTVNTDLYSTFTDNDSEYNDTASVSDAKSTDNSSQMILNESEISQIKSNTASQDFMKYLNVEDNDNGSIYQQLTTPLQTNNIEVTENDTNNDLSKFFANLKDEQYTFEPVPTKPMKQNNLFKDTALLNNNNDASNIQGFDVFNTSFSSV